MKNYSCKFNALRVTVFGDLEPVFIEDFSTYRGMSAPIGFGCERINAVSTVKINTISHELGFTVIGYVDAQGYEKNHIPNRLLQYISGYNMLMGPGVLCGWDNNDYAPLETEQVETLTGYLAKYCELPAMKAKKALASFRQIGEDEFDRGLELTGEGNEVEAHELFIKSADLGYANGLNALAIDYMTGSPVEQDEEKGLELMLKAFDDGSEIAARTLGTYYLFGDHNLPVDYEKAFYYLTEGANKGDRHAMSWLGYMYQNTGYGFRNTAKSAYWLQKSTELDSDLGWMFLGLLINDDTYYRYYPQLVRYCFEQYARIDGGDLEQILKETLDNDELAEEIMASESINPDYPKVPEFVRTDDFPDPEEDCAKLAKLLESESTAVAAMELTTHIANTGYSQACSTGFFMFTDCEQGDSFKMDENTGEVSAFPVDEKKALAYLENAARNGNKVCMRIFPFVGIPYMQGRQEWEAKKYMERYIALTGDWVMEKYIMPNFSKAFHQIVYDGEYIPWFFHDEFEEAEAAVKHLYSEDMTISQRITALENANECQDREAIERLLTYYRYIVNLKIKIQA